MSNTKAKSVILTSDHHAEKFTYHVTPQSVSYIHKAKKSFSALYWCTIEKTGVPVLICKLKVKRNKVDECIGGTEIMNENRFVAGNEINLHDTCKDDCAILKEAEGNNGKRRPHSLVRYENH